MEKVNKMVKNTFLRGHKSEFKATDEVAFVKAALDVSTGISAFCSPRVVPSLFRDSSCCRDLFAIAKNTYKIFSLNE